MFSRNQTLTLCIDLRESEPRIWRRVVIGSHVSLGYLHHVIQAAMGWSDSHLHEFEINRTTYAPPDPDGELPPSQNEDRVNLKDLFKAGLTFSYQYDFGDSWIHSVKVERVEKAEEPMEHAVVLAGERACPPENCGGIHRYQEFLRSFSKASANKDKQVAEFLQWAGGDFNPGQFDRHATNATLMRMAWNRWGR